MASQLVTQVDNPNDTKSKKNVSKKQQTNSNNENDNTPKKSWWSCLCSCMSSSDSSKQMALTPTGPPQHRYVPPGGRLPLGNYLLPELDEADKHKKTLVLDLDETLVHSSFKPVPDADFVISIELEGDIHHVYVLKRPGVDEFLQEVAKKFEVVVFTASLAKYADPLLDVLDKKKTVKYRLFREACVQHYGNYVKDLSQLGRDLAHSLIIDNSPYSYIFQPDNAIPISSWFNDKNDRQLVEILPILDALVKVDDVCAALASQQFQLPTGDM